jgi:hypothetical protein
MDRNRKRTTIRVRNKSRVPQTKPFSISTSEIETPPEHKRIIREHERRLLRELGYLQ